MWTLAQRAWSLNSTLLFCVRLEWPSLSRRPSHGLQVNRWPWTVLTLRALRTLEFIQYFLKMPRGATSVILWQLTTARYLVGPVFQWARSFGEPVLWWTQSWWAQFFCGPSPFMASVFRWAQSFDGPSPFVVPVLLVGLGPVPLWPQSLCSLSPLGCAQSFDGPSLWCRSVIFDCRHCTME